MNKKLSGAAYFMHNARRIEDLKIFREEGMKKWGSSRPYIIEKVIELKTIEFENFSQDLLADRQFIEDNIHLMSSRANDVWHCILVVEKGIDNTGILVVSNKDYPVFTAFYKKRRGLL